MRSFLFALTTLGLALSLAACTDCDQLQDDYCAAAEADNFEEAASIALDMQKDCDVTGDYSELYLCGVDSSLIDNQ